MQLIVIGGGAAGFFCAVTAARMNPECRVTILEKTGKLLSKVRISGGGRCNVTHACFSIPEMSRQYPRGQNFVKKTFHQFFTEDTIDWFKERGVLLKTEPDGRMFPVTDRSETVVNCLLKEADKYKVRVIMNTEVRQIKKEEKKDNKINKNDDNNNNDQNKNENGKWKLIMSAETIEEADIICVACGGYPKESMFEWLRSAGHSVEKPVPSLFTFNIPADPITGLMGVSVKGKVRINGHKLEEEGAVLITHWGLSGPAVLRLSARGARELAAMNYHFTAVLNWLPSFNEQTLKQKFAENRSERGRQQVAGRNDLGLPQRLWEHLCHISSVDGDMRWGELSSEKQRELIRNVTSHEFQVKGKTTYKEEFVTAGGIRLAEIDPNTMQSRLVEGLYFAGEVMDVDAVTGGYNFQHAWTSGWIAGKSIAAL